MARKIQIKIGQVEAIAELNETRTAQAIWEALPITGEVDLWGEEIYFPIPLVTEPENARELVNIGDIAYWPEGNAMCIFLGKTPVSKGSEIRAASPVNIIGRIEEGQKLLGRIKEGDKITVRRR